MMRLRSLQARMLALSAAATLIALALAGWTVSAVLERVVVAGIDRRLDAELTVLASGVRSDGDIDRTRLAQRLSVLDMGPGWRWRIDGPQGSVAAAAFAPILPPPPPDDVAPIGRPPRAMEAHDAGGAVHLRRAVIATSAGPVTLIAAAPRDVIARPIRDAVVPLLTIMVMLAAVFALAAMIQLRVGLRPVRRLRNAVAKIRRGTATRVDEDQPSELRPLAEELNALIVDNEAALATARGSAANLAHALKTPVATLMLTLADDRAASDELARIDATIRHHLARARSGAVARHARTVLDDAVADVAAAVRMLYPAITVETAIAAGLAVALDGHDLTEIAGNLVDNAARHARRAVRVSAAVDGRWAALRVEDDGRGIAAAARDWVTRPGARLDEAPSGDGFGLAIVHALAALYGGTLTLDDAAAGGLRATVTLPLAG